MTKYQVHKLVYNAHDHCFDGDVIAKDETQYSRLNNTTFLCHHTSFADKEGMQCILCFPVAQLLALLNDPMVSHLFWHELIVNCYAQILNLYHLQVKLFVDYTFNIVPHPSSSA